MLKDQGTLQQFGLANAALEGAKGDMVAPAQNAVGQHRTIEGLQAEQAEIQEWPTKPTDQDPMPQIAMAMMAANNPTPDTTTSNNKDKRVGHKNEPASKKREVKRVNNIKDTGIQMQRQYPDNDNCCCRCGCDINHTSFAYPMSLKQTKKPTKREFVNDMSSPLMQQILTCIFSFL